MESRHLEILSCLRYFGALQLPEIVTKLNMRQGNDYTMEEAHSALTYLVKVEKSVNQFQGMDGFTYFSHKAGR